MIRSDRFLISQKPFAIDLSTVTGEQQEHHGRLSYRGTCHALWFRRQNGVTRACLGSLMLFSHNLREPIDLTDPRAILSADLDGRYGGDCHGRWDGTRYWGAQEPHVQALHLTVLEPMLADYPNLPAGYDGWWRFNA